MPIIAEDSNFGVATGANVNSTSISSTFDGPPSQTTNLVIQPDPDDPNPYLFNLGETYDLSYTDPSGANVVLDNAVVLRSDEYITGKTAIVFRGADANGNDVDVIWAPDGGLQTWYDIQSVWTSPKFFVTDLDGSTYGHICLAAQTLIDTPRGPQRLDKLAPGDRVSTLDNGAAVLRWVGARRVPGLRAGAPVLFEAGTIGNNAPLRLSQQHRVLLAHPLAELYHGSGEVLVPAKSLVNGSTIRPAPCARITWMNLLTDGHDIIRAAGAAVETLFLGEMARQVIADAKTDAAQYPGLAGQEHAGQVAARPMLRHGEAQNLLAMIRSAPPPAAAKAGAGAGAKLRVFP